MSTATPTKRRALGALDANVLTRSPSRSSAAKVIAASSKNASPLKKARHATTTPSPARSKEGSTTPTKKRTLDGAGIADPISKKLCSAPASDRASPAKVMPPVAKSQDVEQNSTPASTRRSLSPDASSLFDNSTINTSQLTTITEPDAAAPLTTTAPAAPSLVSTTSAIVNAMPDLPPPRPRRVPPTREEFRQKAEILKLRLSLASYKVKTNQTDVPLEELQVKPVPGMTRPRAPLLPSMSAHTVERATPVQYWYRSLATPTSSQQVADSEDSEGEDAVPGFGGGMVTPPRKQRGMDEEVRLTSSGLRGGAAKGLLSLSQASS